MTPVFKDLHSQVGVTKKSLLSSMTASTRDTYRDLGRTKEGIFMFGCGVDSVLKELTLEFCLKGISIFEVERCSSP